MQSSSSTSIIRHSCSAALASFVRRREIYHGRPGVGVKIRRSFYLLSGKRENPPNVSTKIFLRTLFAPALSFDDTPPLEPSEAIGTVAAAQANFMRVIVARDGDDGSSKTCVELVCVVKSVLKKMKRIVLVGDKVFVGSIDWTDQRGMIKNPFTLTRFLVEAEFTGIPLTLALNKSELVTQEEMEYWRTRLRRWNYEPLFCSVKTNVGLDAIETHLRNQTSVIVGPSGVGKSSLINVLRSSISGAIEKEKGFKPVLDIKCFESGRQAFVEQGCKQKKKRWFDDQSVRTVSTSNGQGRHTTRNVSLLPVCGGGYLADTPGFNKHKLLKVTKQLLPMCFPEMRKMIEGRKCLFEDCLHIGVRGCAVKDGWERYPYYLQLLDEIRIEEESQLKKYGTKRESDVRYSKVKVKEDTGEIEIQDVPRLDPKKYKRESRKMTKQRTMAEFD
ncbi:hypothetical protein AALP_AAs72598U000100 [Arabis alpina]|uniref:EngC GTPase domain-containing protein n=1 Tax=Arabis alpina TaxID=50452 RepID=A0A087G2W1_ARAAL|nr:hypothetical protein AALP_AAs72598U000100 [Arabis alpina]